MGRGNIRRLLGTLIASATSLVLIASCDTGGTAAGGNGTQVRVGSPAPTAALWPIYVAQAEGFFDQAGIQVPVTYVGGGQGIQQVISGDFEVFVTNPDQPIAAVAKGGDLTGVSGGVNSTFSLVGSKAAENVEALRNQAVGVANVAGTDTAMIKAILAKHGLKSGDYTVTQTGSGPNKLSAMASGAVNAVTLTQPQDQQYLTQTPGAHKIADSSELGTLQTIAAFASTKWAKANSDVLVKFLGAQLQARAWLGKPENRAAAISVLAKATSITPEIAAAIYDQYAQQGLFRTAVDVDLAGVDSWLQMATDAGLGKYGPAAKYFDLSYLQSARQSAK